MKKYLIIIAALFVFGTTTYAQDSTQIRKRLRTPSDTTQVRTPRRDCTNFIDKDGDGINDNRNSRSMGLKKSNGKHNCVPQNQNNNKGKKGKRNN